MSPARNGAATLDKQVSGKWSEPEQIFRSAEDGMAVEMPRDAQSTRRKESRRKMKKRTSEMASIVAQPLATAPETTGPGRRTRVARCRAVTRRKGFRTVFGLKNVVVARFDVESSGDYFPLTGFRLYNDTRHESSALTRDLRRVLPDCPAPEPGDLVGRQFRVEVEEVRSRRCAPYFKVVGLHPARPGDPEPHAGSRHRRPRRIPAKFCRGTVVG